MIDILSKDKNMYDSPHYIYFRTRIGGILSTVMNVIIMLIFIFSFKDFLSGENKKINKYRTMSENSKESDRDLILYFQFKREEKKFFTILAMERGLRNGFTLTTECADDQYRLFNQETKNPDYIYLCLTVKKSYVYALQMMGCNNNTDCVNGKQIDLSTVSANISLLTEKFDPKSASMKLDIMSIGSTEFTYIHYNYNYLYDDIGWFNINEVNHNYVDIVTIQNEECPLPGQCSIRVISMKKKSDLVIKRINEKFQNILAKSLSYCMLVVYSIFYFLNYAIISQYIYMRLSLQI
jgi:hypothetical protein